jgi:hypothetical protein
MASNNLSSIGGLIDVCGCAKGSDATHRLKNKKGKYHAKNHAEIDANLVAEIEVRSKRQPADPRL